MPEPMKLPVEGDDVKVGDVDYELTAEGGLTMQQVGVIRKTFNVGGLLAKKAKLEAELAGIETLLAKHAELSQ